MDEYIMYLSTEEYDELQARLAEPPRVLPELKRLLDETPIWSK